MIGHTKATTLIGLCALVAALPGLTKAQTYSVIPIPLPPGTEFQSVSGVNSSNQVTGFVYVFSGFGFQAFLGAASGSTLIPFPPGWSFDSFAYGINNAGQVAGYDDTQGQAFIGALSGSTAIPSPAEWDYAQAFAINNANPVQVTGGGSIGGVPLAFIGTASILTVITPPPGWTDLNGGYGINDSGQVVGWGFNGGTYNQAFFYTAGVATPIPVAEGMTNTYGMCVNNLGGVAGNGDTAAFVGTVAGTVAIPLPAGATYASVSEGCINDFGAVVGTSDAGGWIWDPVNQTQILNNLVAPGHDILMAYSINNAGVILACDGEDCVEDGPVLLIPGATSGDGGYQVRYATNFSAGESYIDIGNTGANGAALNGPGYGVQVGNICANVYAVDPGEELVSCCSCLITPDQTVHLGVNADLLVNTANGVKPTSIMIKLVETLAGAATTGTSCIQSAASAGGTAFPLGAGMAAFGTTLHAGSTAGSFVTTETPFTPATLSPAELASLTGRCTAIIGDLSGAGVCNSCHAGALGAAKK